MFPTDQIFLAHVLANRDACYFHASGVKIQDKGYLFVGPPNAGKSTVVSLLKGKAKILCDDRIIVRRHSRGFRLYGTWSHGELPDVSSESAPIKGVFFLHKSKHCLAVPIDKKQVAARFLLDSMVKPYATADWWEKSLFLIQNLIRDVPFYSLYFDKSDRVFDKVNSV